jgi:peptidoglycan/xylan/chitin deacetylase (PgdA/CDA1 family)
MCPHRKWDFTGMIPVFVYHHVRPKGFLTDLCVSTEIFEEQLKYIVKKGYQTILSSELVKKYGNQRSIGKSVVLTFDDGYIDNYFYAFPLLRRYGVKATIFVATGLMAKAAHNNKATLFCSHDEINRIWAEGADASDHFLSWQEMKEMVDSGLIEFQSHGNLHLRHFVSDEVIGIFHGSNPWFFPLCVDIRVREGMALFRSESSLSSRRFRVDEKILEICYEKYNEYKNVMAINDICELLKKHLIYLKAEMGQIGSFEEQINYEKRVQKDLETSVRLIRDNVGATPDLLAYPWGSYNDDVIRIAKALGFKGGFTLGTRKRKNNNVSEKIFSIGRIIAEDKVKSFKRALWKYDLMRMINILKEFN